MDKSRRQDGRAETSRDSWKSFNQTGSVSFKIKSPPKPGSTSRRGAQLAPAGFTDDDADDVDVIASGLGGLEITAGKVRARAAS